MHNVMDIIQTGSLLHSYRSDKSRSRPKKQRNPRLVSCVTDRERHKPSWLASAAFRDETLMSASTKVRSWQDLQTLLSRVSPGCTLKVAFVSKSLVSAL